MRSTMQCVLTDIPTRNTNNRLLKPIFLKIDYIYYYLNKIVTEVNVPRLKYSGSVMDCERLFGGACRDRFATVTLYKYQ